MRELRAAWPKHKHRRIDELLNLCFLLTSGLRRYGAEMVPFFKYTCTALVPAPFCKTVFPRVGSLHKVMFAVYFQVFSFDPHPLSFG